MGLDIGIITVKYLDRPKGDSYQFAWEMAIEASSFGYMSGEGNNWAPFSQRQVLRLLDEFSIKNKLTKKQKSEVHAWIKSLPWEGWRENLKFRKRIPEEDEFLEDYEADDVHGGVIELHFNW